MKNIYSILLLPLIGSLATAQMEPGNYAVIPDISGTQPKADNGNSRAKSSSKSSSKKSARNVDEDDEDDYDDPPARSGSRTTNYDDDGEPENPRLLGMELPLLDPSSDTMTYNGAKFDVGNNAAVRAMFETYLSQSPEDSAEAKKYRKRMADIEKLTQNNARKQNEVGSDTLAKIGRGLYEAGDYPGDGGQANTLAQGIATALAVQYANRTRDRQNQQLDHEIEKLVRDTNIKQTRNENRPSKEVGSGRNRQRQQDQGKSNQFLIAQQTANIATKQGTKTKNEAANTAAMEMAKVAFQSMILSQLADRRFDHVVIASNAYRHIFRDGSSKLDLKKDSQASQLFEGIGGMPPTVAALSSFAAGTRQKVDKHMQSVGNLLAQNKLGEATQHLIEAVILGEYMESVVTFPTEGRRRVAEYWTLRKRSLSALNSRDYGTLEEVADKMKELDSDFDDSMLRSYISGRKRQSDMCLRNAKKAFMAGDEEAANEYAKQAAIIWPRNPNLDKMEEEVVKLDNNDPVMAEFKTLMGRKEYRHIFNEQDKFEVVALDKDLKQQYKDCITLISTIDGMLKQLDIAAETDRKMGPCMAYEMLVDQREKDARYGEDSAFKDAMTRFSLGAHDFVQALDDGKEQESRGEYGSALANYYRAQCLYPKSRMAKEGIDRVSQVILKSKF